MSASAARQLARMSSGTGDKPGLAAFKSIETSAVASCREIHVLSGLRCAGFKHHP